MNYSVGIPSNNILFMSIVRSWFGLASNRDGQYLLYEGQVSQNEVKFHYHKVSCRQAVLIRMHITLKGPLKNKQKVKGGPGAPSCLPLT